MSKNNFAICLGKPVFRLIFNKKDNTYDIENGLMQQLNTEPLMTHDESMAFIHKFSLANSILAMSYTFIER